MSDELRIRLATSADATSVATLSRTAIEHDLPWRWTPQRVRLEARERNTAALAFYRHHGWRVTATIAGMYLGVEDGVRLEKALGPGDAPAR